MKDVFKIIKDAKIDLQYLSDIGFDISKRSGCCPIHNGDSKSGFSYKEGNDGNYMFQCYSDKCTDGRAIDVIRLCELKEGLTNIEACKFLANKYGILLPGKEYTEQDKIQYAKKKKAEEDKKQKIQVLEEAKKQALENKDLEKALEIEMEKDREEKEPLSILNYPSLNHKGKPLKTWDNLKALLEHNKIDVVFNDISKNIEVKGLQSDDLEDCIMDIHMIAHANDLNLNIDFIGKAINRIGSLNSYNPVADYLQKCYFEWDGKEGRVKDLCNTLVVAEDFSENLRDKLVTKWLLNTVKIPFNDGKFNTEGILVLQGKQGLRKTTWVNKITPKELENYTKTGLNLDPNDKDKIYQSIKYWLAELGELDATMKAEQSKLKAFFTEKVDEFRRPYARNTSRYPRRTSFFGTVNKREFLKDDTGDRRYWVVPCIKIQIDKLEKIDINQLWGEVMHLEEKGIIHYLTEEDLDELNGSNKDFRAKGKTYITIETGFNWNVPEKMYKFKSKEEIANKFNLQTTAGLNEVFEQLGIKETKGSITVNGKTSRPRGYKVPPYKDEYIPYSSY